MRAPVEELAVWRSADGQGARPGGGVAAVQGPQFGDAALGGLIDQRLAVRVEFGWVAAGDRYQRQVGVLAESGVQFGLALVDLRVRPL
jgi:hypothetical protein